VDDLGKFTGSYLTDSVTIQQTNINDAGVSPSEVWSSAKIQSELNKLWAVVNIQVLYSNQLITGLTGLRLEYLDSTHIRLIPTIGQEVTVIFPDYTQRTIPIEGLATTFQGNTGTMYYVYVGETTFHVSDIQPETTTDPLNIHEYEILVGFMGMSATDMISGSWNVYSCWNEGEKTWSVDRLYENLPMYQNDTHEVLTDMNLPGLVIPPGKTAIAKVNGITRFWYWKTSAPTEQGQIVEETINGTGIYGGSNILGSKGSAQFFINPESWRSATGAGVYYDAIQDDVYISIWDADLRAGFYSLEGQLSVVRSGN
jgi:hypothetical protein